MTINTVAKPEDPTIDLTDDEWDGQLIEEWLAAYRLFPDFVGLVPGSARYTEDIDFAHQNPAAWAHVTLPSGLSRVEVVKLMSSQVLRRHLPGKHDQQSHAGKSKAMAGGLTPEQYAALIPHAYSSEDRQMLIGKLSETPEGKVLADTMVRFQEHEFVKPFREDIDAKLNGAKLPPEREAQIDAFLDSVKHVPPTMPPPVLYRGMTLKQPPPLTESYQVGAVHKFSVASYSSSKTISEEYQAATSDYGNTKVMIELTGPKKALPIQNLSKNESLYREQEWVSTGQFKVAGISGAGTSSITVQMTYEGTLT